MSTSEIIEYEGRRFVRTGEVRRAKANEYYWDDWAKRVGHALKDHKVVTPSEILRELPAETPALATCHFPFIPGKTPGGQDKIPRTCEKCGAYPVASWEDNRGLLAEAEEALERVIVMRCDIAAWFGKEPENVVKRGKIMDEVRAVLARIRAAKEKQS